MTLLCLEVLGLSDPLVRSVLAGLGEHNAAWFALRRDAPEPATVVEYVPDEPSTELRLLDASRLLEVLRGSCGSLAAAQWGYLRAQGHRPQLLVRAVERGVWHSFIRRPNGSLWQPGKAWLDGAA